MNKLDEMKQMLEFFGYDSYTNVQEEVIPSLLEGDNVFVLSKTGSGKTLSYLLPAIDKIVWEQKEPQVLILACTRELVRQIKEECDIAGSKKRIKSVCIYGKENIENQKALLKQQCHIVIATPGRLLDLINQNLVSLSSLKMIVVDEADYMFDLGFYETIKQIYTFLPLDVQQAYFSATKKEELLSLMEEYAPSLKRITLHEQVDIEHYYHLSNTLESDLKEMLCTLDIESAIVFCKTKEEVNKVYETLKKDIPCTILHGDLIQKQRFQNLSLFAQKEVRVLIASDIAARGIDISKVSHVFHYNGCNHEIAYIHRCGRSGRKNESGVSILLLKTIEDVHKEIIEKFNALPLEEYKIKNECSLFTQVAIEEKKALYKSQVERIYINAGSEKKISARDIIGSLLSIEGIEKEDIGVIEILRRMTYVEIYHKKASLVVEMMKDKTIKKKKVKVEIAK